MKKYNLNLYKTIVVLFISIIFILSYENYNLFLEIKTISVNSLPSSSNSEIKKYGYSDILSLLLKDNNIKIINISSDLEDKNIVNIEIGYYGDMSSLYNTLEKFQTLDNFCYVDNIKINTDSNGKQVISSNICFIKNQ